MRFTVIGFHSSVQFEIWEIPGNGSESTFGWSAWVTNESEIYVKVSCSVQVKINSDCYRCYHKKTNRWENMNSLCNHEFSNFSFRNIEFIGIIQYIGTICTGFQIPIRYFRILQTPSLQQLQGHILLDQLINRVVWIHTERFILHINFNSIYILPFS